MKLVNRVSLFFLAALAVVLAAYATLFYAIERGQLLQRFEHDLYSSLNSLVAAVEVEPEEAKWQPAEHSIAVASQNAPGALWWVVVGDGETLVQCSPNANFQWIDRALELARELKQDQTRQREIADRHWRMVTRRLVAPAPDRAQRELDEFDEIVIVVAGSTVDLNANLQRLGVLSCVLPIGTWLVAAAAGHWYCRRALQPVVEMAGCAGNIAATDFESRLPVSKSGDELDELAGAFNKLLDRQREAIETQRRFASDAAHELRTPLTVLLGHLDVALRRSRTPAEYEATLALLRNQTAELQQTVESLMFLARADQEAALPRAEAIALGSWLPNYLARWQGSPRHEDLLLHIDTAGAGAVDAPPALLANVLDNLIGNALKFSPPRTPVSITVGAQGGSAQIDVRDQGRGIVPEDMQAIFKPFFRSRAATEAGVPGTGLGLAIAARIATAIGGELTCSSQPGAGSCFSLRIPLKTKNAS
jgi:signal transduction histidine kinase